MARELWRISGEVPPASVITTPSPSYTPVLYAQRRGSNSYALAQRHPNLNLTPEEKRVFYQLFQAADTTNLGVITGEIAVPFFEKTHLPPDTLGLVCGR
jgi:epidermal growth factor receptor substrate 15